MKLALVTPFILSVLTEALFDAGSDAVGRIGYTSIQRGPHLRMFVGQSPFPGTPRGDRTAPS